MIGRLKFWFIAAMLGTLPLLALAFLSRPVAAAGLWYVAPGGDDTHDCQTTVTPCANIDGAIGKAAPGDTIDVAIGTYSVITGSEVVSLTKSIDLSGGWNAAFTTQNGMSTIDGGGLRRAIAVTSGVTVTIEYLIAQNGNAGINGAGGGIRNFGILTLNNSIVSGNNITQNGSGGGISNNGTLILNNSIVSGNTSSYGGGIDSVGALTLNNSTVSGNTSTYSGAGGISNTGPLTLNNSTVGGNTSYIGSGGISNGGNLTLNNSTVSGNTNSLSGAGGISNGGTLTLNNSTVSGNTSGGAGGGIYNYNGTLTLNNSTVSGNTSPQNGSGMGGGIFTYGTATLQNSLVAGNSGFFGADCNGAVGSAGYNLIGVINGCNFKSASGDIVGVDPKLDALQDNGGPAPTQALLPGSPAIHAGNPGGCFGSSGLLATDERGYPRLGRCDIGAFQVQPFDFSAKTVNHTSTQPGQLLHYTISLSNTGVSVLSTVAVTDTLLAGLTYANGSLTATSGTYNYSAGVITWTGSVTAGGLVTLDFDAVTAPNLSMGTVITNTAIISGAGEVFSRRAVTTLALAKLYLPLVLKPLPGIQGYVTINGAPAAGVFLELRHWNGQSYFTESSTSSDASGFYDFTSASSLAPGQSYYVRYLNHQTDTSRLSYWATAYITHYTAGGSYGAGNFDLADVTLASPANGATVALPAHFQWVRRAATSSDSYQFNLFDPNGNAFGQTVLLGYVNGVTIHTVPSDFHSGMIYGWFVAVNSPDGGYGESYYYRQVTFSSVLAGSQPSEAGGAQVSAARPPVDRPRR